ncbi:hypothetical protein [Streptomyces katrae]|uniref:hypothetical protein n=1 Tax=Streptomyces katrae TaxID=68223 RepID=UPI00068BDE63|nr:hypothetical protein [Streptomyces katrae]
MRTVRSGQLITVAATAMGVGLAGLVGAAPSHATEGITVRCSSQSLQTAINNAAAGATLRLSGHCVGPFTITKNLTLTSGQDADAVLDGNQAGSTLTVSGAGVRVKLEKLRIIGGRSSTEGGGINNLGATVTVARSEISENTSANGGGISNQGNGTVNLDHSTVRHNTASGFGGGIDNLVGTLTVTDSRLQDNTATTGNGGALFNSATATLTRSVVEHNSAVRGGGIRNVGSGTTLTLVNTKVRYNLATLQGGGISLDEDATATLRDSKVHDNTASGGPGSGGGIRTEGGAVTLTRTTVENNHPDNCAPAGAIPNCTDSLVARPGTVSAPPARPDGDRGDED